MEKTIKTILIIEDDRQILKAYKDGLKMKSFNVLTSSNGEEGLEMAAKEKPDLIMLDLMLPDMPGELILKKMNESGMIKKIPVIVLSNKSDNATMYNCSQVLGASDFLIKADYTIEGIERKINNVLMKKAYPYTQ